ncbi:hypothetical protein MMC26_006993 [Xylographa opegraphella]|nr:hypothetical protein [Xylographa opegraphella]
MQLPAILAFLALLLTPTLGTVLSKPVPEPGATYHDGRIVPAKGAPAAPAPKHPATQPKAPHGSEDAPHSGSGNTHAHGSQHRQGHRKRSPDDDIGSVVVVARSPIKSGQKPPPAKKSKDKDKDAKKADDPRPQRKDSGPPAFGPGSRVTIPEWKPYDKSNPDRHQMEVQYKHGYSRRGLYGPRGGSIVVREAWPMRAVDPVWGYSSHEHSARDVLVDAGWE